MEILLSWNYSRISCPRKEARYVIHRNSAIAFRYVVAERFVWWIDCNVIVSPNRRIGQVVPDKPVLITSTSSDIDYARKQFRGEIVAYSHENLVVWLSGKKGKEFVGGLVCTARIYRTSDIAA
jgi:hypothetical protein